MIQRDNAPSGSDPNGDCTTFANVVKPFVLTSSIIHETPSRNVNSSFCQSVILARHSLDILGGVFYFQPNFDNPLRKPSFDFQRRAR